MKPPEQSTENFETPSKRGNVICKECKEILFLGPLNYPDDVYVKCPFKERGHECKPLGDCNCGLR